MGEIQSFTSNFSSLEMLTWFLYPLFALIAWSIGSDLLDDNDDDDFDGGMGIPIFQGSQS